MRETGGGEVLIAAKAARPTPQAWQKRSWPARQGWRGEEQWQEAGLEGGRWGRGGKEAMTQGPSDKLFFDSCTLWARYFSHWTCSHTRGCV